MKSGQQCNQNKVLLKEVRKKLGLTQAQMATYLGVHRDNLNKFENGKLEFEWLDRAIKLQKLMHEAGYDLEDLKMQTPQN